MAAPDGPGHVNVDAYTNVDHLYWDNVLGATSYNVYKTANKCPNCYFRDIIEFNERWTYTNSCGIVDEQLRMTVPRPDAYTTDNNINCVYNYLTDDENDFEVIISLNSYERDPLGYFYGLKFYFGIVSESADVTAGFWLRWSSGLADPNKYRLNNWGLPLIDTPGGFIYCVLPDKFKIWREGNIFRSDVMLSGAWNNDTGWKETLTEAQAKQRYYPRLRLLLDSNYPSSTGGYCEVDDLIVNPAPVFLKNVTGTETCYTPEEGDDTLSYAIAAKNDDGTSDLSEEEFINRLGTLEDPIPPTIASEQIRSNILLSWDKPDIPGMHFLFNVYYLAEEETDGDTIKDTGQKISSIDSNYLIFEPEERGITYSFVVTSVSNNICLGESGVSNVTSIAVLSESEVLYPGDLIMQEIYENVAYRLNIAKDIHARAEQVRFWSNEELLRAINEGYMDFVRRTECLQRFEIIGITSGTGEYDLPSDCIRVLWVGYDNKMLHGQSLSYMDGLDDDWIGRAGEPAYFVQELGGIKKLQLYETPDVSGVATFIADTNHTEADADHGLLVGLTDDSTATTFTADSNHTEADADHGIVVHATGDSVLFSGFTEMGIITGIEQHNDNLIILFAYEPPLFETLQDAEAPHFMAVYHWAIVYFALSELFLKEGDVQNVPLANFYKMIYEDAVENKLKTKHAANLSLRYSQNTVADRLPAGPHLPLDQYPLYRR